MLSMLIPALLAGAVVPGFVAARRGAGEALATPIWRFLYWSGVPAAPVMLSAAPLDRAGPAALAAAAALAVVLVPAGLYARRRFVDGRERAAFTLSAFMPNSGWLGLPLVLMLLGPGALPAAALYNSLVGGLVCPPLGVAIAAGHRHAGRRRLEQALRGNPFLAAAVVGALWALLPLPHPALLLTAASWWVMLTAVPAFFAFGVALAQAPLRLDADVAAAVLLRLLAAPLALAACSLVVPVPRAFLLLAAMATGLSTLTYAGEHDLPLQRITPAIAWSTALVLSAAAAWTVASAAAV